MSTFELAERLSEEAAKEEGHLNFKIRRAVKTFNDHI
jgi:hypothetical protein